MEMGVNFGQRINHDEQVSDLCLPSHEHLQPDGHEHREYSQWHFYCLLIAADVVSQHPLVI